mmetsp:Transcript_24777/g.73304  ORF Transcript_24777/g.73304 Transcript_24777/m.73304 type:complete len:131 (-) Transcript_24777:206-598(-)
MPAPDGSQPLEIVQDLEAYLSKNALDTIVKDMMVECLSTRPEHPESWMMRYMLQKNAGESSDNCAVASTVEQDMFVAVCHTDTHTQKYLSEKKVHAALLELLRQVADAQPDNVLSFLAQAAHKLHKEGLQ